MSELARQMEPETVTVTVGAELMLPACLVPPVMRRALYARLTRDNPDKRQRDRMGLASFDIPDRICLVREEKHGIESFLCVPRGALSIVQAAADRAGIDLAFESRAVENGVGARNFNDTPVVLRKYQKEAIEKLITRVQGYIRLPCGGGKTVLGAGAVYKSGQAALILVHTHELAKQWSDTFMALYGVRVRRAGASWAALKPGEVAIGMVQKIHRAGWRARKLLGSCGVVLVDEAHHCPAATYRDIMRCIPARYRWGLTATPERPDGWSFLLPLTIGPELYGMTAADLVAAGHLIHPVIMPIKTNQSVSLTDKQTGRPNMAGAVSKLCKLKDRTNLIIELALHGAQHGRTVLILVPRVAYAHQLAKMLCHEGIKAAAITGRVPKAVRGKIMTRLRSGDLQIAVATQLADEGLDVPRLDLMIIASAGRSAGKAIQRMGRAMRNSPGKKRPIVVDLVDGGVFYSQWRARQSAYLTSLGTDVASPVPLSKAIDLFVELLNQP